LGGTADVVAMSQARAVNAAGTWVDTTGRDIGCLSGVS
jgi:hypothetical protein